MKAPGRTQRLLRVYADSSVFGGVFDAEFAITSEAFFQQVREGRFRLVVSAVLREELEPAPEEVRDLFDALLASAEFTRMTENALRLQQAYLTAGIVTPKWSRDAFHVALATVAGCDLIVSWNFKHIVHFEKIPLYNAVNALEGFGSISIYSPLEVIRYEDEDL
jgi:hypothetical protein